MKKVLPIFILSLFLWRCESEHTLVDSQLQPPQEAVIAILQDEMENFDIEDFDDEKEQSVFLKSGQAEEITGKAPVKFDSNYVWKFYRTDVRRKSISFRLRFLSETQCIGTIAKRITGIFHVEQYERIWEEDGSWRKGDLVDSSEKPFNYRLKKYILCERVKIVSETEQVWRKIGRTPVYGKSENSKINIKSLIIKNLTTGQSYVLSQLFRNFDSWKNDQVAFATGDKVKLELRLTNDSEGETELAWYKWRYRSCPDENYHRKPLKFIKENQYGKKIYVARFVISKDESLFNTRIKVLDLNSVFDHHNTDYRVTILNYWFKIIEPKD